jgi:hypothetical protein
MVVMRDPVITTEIRYSGLRMSGMRRYTAQKVARRGREIYEREIRREVEPEHDGRFLAVNVESGDYALADDELGAIARAREQNSEGDLFLIRVGSRAAHRIGSLGSRRTR